MDNLQALCVECHSEKTIKERRNCKKIRNAIEQILSEYSNITSVLNVGTIRMIIYMRMKIIRTMPFVTV